MLNTNTLNSLIVKNGRGWNWSIHLGAFSGTQRKLYEGTEAQPGHKTAAHISLLSGEPLFLQEFQLIAAWGMKMPSVCVAGPTPGSVPRATKPSKVELWKESEE